LLHWLVILLVEQGISKVILYSFEWLHFSEHCLNHNIISHVFEALVQRGGDDPIGKDPQSSEQEIVRRVSVDDVAHHF